MTRNSLPAWLTLLPLLQAVAMDALSLEQQLPPYPFFTQPSSQQQQQPAVASSLPQTPPLLQSSGLQRGPQLPPLSVTVPSSIPQSPPGSQSQPSMGIDINSVSLPKGEAGNVHWGVANQLGQAHDGENFKEAEVNFKWFWLNAALNVF